MQSQYNVVFTGELKPGFDRDAVIKAFSQRFQCAEAKAIEVLDAGKAVIMKSAVAREVAEKYQDTLDALGLMVKLETHSTSSSAEVPPAATNPYQPPAANLQQSHADGEMTGPISVPFGHGVSWLGSAWRNHFTNNPIAWIAALIVIGVLSLVVQLIPLLGFIVSSLISPIFGAGFMIGASAQDKGEDFTVGHAFSGFQNATGQLVLVGVFYIIGLFVIILISAAIMGGSFAMFDMMEGDPAAIEAMMQNPAGFALPFLIMALLVIPLVMAYWFAPALVALDGLSALNAMKLSFVGCMKNVLPFLLYGIVLTVLMVLAVIPIGLGLLLLLPVMMASMYTSYRDIYHPAA